MIRSDRAGLVPTSAIQSATCKIRFLRHLTLPTSLQNNRCDVVSLQTEQLGQMFPRWANSFCLDKLASTAATPNTCLPVNIWNIFGSLCRVEWTSGQETSSNWCFDIIFRWSNRPLASCLCAVNRRTESVSDVVFTPSTIIMMGLFGNGRCV